MLATIEQNWCGYITVVKLHNENLLIAKSRTIFEYPLLIIQKCMYIFAKSNHLIIVPKLTKVLQVSHSEISTFRSNFLAVTIHEVLYALKCNFLT
jgi:hypothetical protein